MQEQVVDVVGLEVLEGVLEHLHSRFQIPLMISEVAEFCCYELFGPVVARCFERNACR